MEHGMGLEKQNAAAASTAAANTAESTPEPGSAFFQNTACEFFPCHDGVSVAEFNCLLCYCPLYALGPACGGMFAYTESGVKDCSACIIPHCGTRGVEHVDHVFPRIAQLAQNHAMGPIHPA